MSDTSSSSSNITREPTEQSSSGSSSNITFVTAFMNIYPKDAPYGGKDFRWRFDRFIQILETGIQLAVYVDETGVDLLEQCMEIFPNLKIMKVMSIYETWVHRLCEQYGGQDIALPAIRNTPKDTYEYLVLMNSKIEFIHDTVEKNPWNTEYFAWIDFNVAHVFKDPVGSADYLKMISRCRLERKFLAIPGCWPIISPGSSDSVIQHVILTTIHWRFCGGFFLGDRESVQKFYQTYVRHFPDFLFKYKQLTWEVNVWAWLEFIDRTFKPSWYTADHDDTIVRIPCEYLATCLSDDVLSYQMVTYNYPEIPDFVPMSASIAELPNSSGLRPSECLDWRVSSPLPDGDIILNTRFVNYTLANNGSYIFHHPDRTIITKNVYSRLNGDTLLPDLYCMVENPPEDELESHPCPFNGIEDIRIWSEGKGEDQVIRFMGTSVNFSNCGKNRMITGAYASNPDMITGAYASNPDMNLVRSATRDVSHQQLTTESTFGAHSSLVRSATRDVSHQQLTTESTFGAHSSLAECSVVDPPTDTGCEKNWTPIPRNNGAPTDFVYKWWPMTIGQLKTADPANKKQTYLHIHTTYELKSPIFKKLRGSTYFREYKSDTRYLVGLLHLSEKDWPRFYYHVLVLLDRETLRPVRYTQPFSFTKRTTIEFCIGFLERDGSYHFWISMYDRDAMKVSIDASDLPFLFEAI